MKKRLLLVGDCRRCNSWNISMLIHLNKHSCNLCSAIVFAIYLGTFAANGYNSNRNGNASKDATNIFIKQNVSTQNQHTASCCRVNINNSIVIKVREYTENEWTCASRKYAFEWECLLLPHISWMNARNSSKQKAKLLFYEQFKCSTKRFLPLHHRNFISKTNSSEIFRIPIVLIPRKNFFELFLCTQFNHCDEFNSLAHCW